MVTRIVVLRRFRYEAFHEGNLVHELDCGHVQDAWINHADGMPVEKRPCNICEQLLERRS